MSRFRILLHIADEPPRVAGFADLCLGTLAEHIGHEFHHHNAQDDAEAAGYVLLAMMGIQKRGRLLCALHDRSFWWPGEFTIDLP